jgi:glycerophosphoryl diester phosphodiesterase
VLLVSLIAVALAGAALEAGDQRTASIEAFMTPGSTPRIIAHRGFSGKAPENTLVAVDRAMRAGADMVEVDVTVTADGHVICLHDETLDRTTDGRGSPIERTLSDIRRLDAGSWFDPAFAGERVPTLDEVLGSVKDRILINIEIKPEAVDHGIVPRVVALIAEHRIHGGAVVSSFSPEALRRIKTTDPAVVTASLFNAELHDGRDPLEIVQEVGSRGFNLSAKRVTADIVERCHRHGIPVAVYTVNDPVQARRLRALGVDAFFTDHPDRLIDALADEPPRPVAGTG